MKSLQNALSTHCSTRLVEATVHLAVKRLRQQTPQGAEIVAPSAWADLAGHLQQRLSRTLRYLVSGELIVAATRSKRSHSRDQVFAVSVGINASKLSLRQLFEFLPGAKETVEMVVADWVTAQQRMLVRLRRDWDRLSSILPQSAKRRLKRVTPGFSDPHDHGQTVTVLGFTGGSRVVYKPRSCEGEQIWFSALHWLNEEGFRPTFYVPKLISRPTYSWMSFVERRCCDSKQEVRDFYFRWGAQAAIAQLLGCADLHRANWIASGQNPVLVDAEMLGHAFLRSKRERLFDEHLHPLLRTGLLPLRQSDAVGYYRGIAPFDNASFRTEKKLFWPVYSGKVERPGKYRDQILEGFTTALSFLQGPREKKGFSNFVLLAWRRKQVRVLKRATVHYYRLLQDSLQPQHMQRGGQRLQYLLDRCGRGQLAELEAASLFRCCVPRFTTLLHTDRYQRSSVPLFRTALNSRTIFASRLKPGVIQAQRQPLNRKGYQ
jgi:lantibiotic modifying enzyme